MLLFRFSGLLLLRLAARQLSDSLFQEPPRSTRRSTGSPTGNAGVYKYRLDLSRRKKISGAAARRPRGQWSDDGGRNNRKPML
jgi:hypothetical protein